MNIAEIKEKAKLALTGNWSIAIGMFLLYLIPNFILQLLSDKYFWFILLVNLFVIAPLTIGYILFHLEIKRTKPLSVKLLVKGYSKSLYPKFVAANLLLTLIVSLGLVVLIVPGIILGLMYSQTFYVMHDHPDMNSLQALKESRRVMNGKKMQLFKLNVSLLKWIILPFLMFIGGTVVFIVSKSLLLLTISAYLVIIGILLIIGIAFYLSPYYFTASATFYDEIIYEPTLNSNTDSPIPL